MSGSVTPAYVLVLGSKSSGNGGAIAGGVIAAVLVLMALLGVAIVLIWYYRKRLAGFLYFNTPSKSK